MLRLKGQTESGEWVEFGINLVLGVNSLADRWFIGINGKIVKILIETIRPADDPRKAMLENVRDRFLWLFGNNKTHSIISLVQVNSIIDEEEAKL